MLVYMINSSWLCVESYVHFKGLYIAKCVKARNVQAKSGLAHIISSCKPRALKQKEETNLTKTQVNKVIKTLNILTSSKKLHDQK